MKLKMTGARVSIQSDLYLLGLVLNYVFSQVPKLSLTTRGEHANLRINKKSIYPLNCDSLQLLLKTSFASYKGDIE